MPVVLYLLLLCLINVQEIEHLDISLIRDTRTGKSARLPKVTQHLVSLFLNKAHILL